MAEEIGFENGRNSNFQGPWPWPWIRPYGIPSCITHRPLPIYQISFKSKKLFVDVQTYGRTFFPLILLGRLLEVDLKINKAYSMLCITKRNFKHLNIQCFTLLYNKSMVRSHLDYCRSVWNPYHKGDIEALEKVLKRATKISLNTYHIVTVWEHVF